MPCTHFCIFVSYRREWLLFICTLAVDMILLWIRLGMQVRLSFSGSACTTTTLESVIVNVASKHKYLRCKSCKNQINISRSRLFDVQREGIAQPKLARCIVMVCQCDRAWSWQSSSGVTTYGSCKFAINIAQIFGGVMPVVVVFLDGRGHIHPGWQAQIWNGTIRVLLDVVSHIGAASLSDV